jgi:hypothetical protein
MPPALGGAVCVADLEAAPGVMPCLAAAATMNQVV